MRITELVRLVFINIFENRFKALLTSLGIMVGAATIVMVIAIGMGSKADVEEQFKNLSAGSIEISYSDAATSGFGGTAGGPGGGGPPGGFGGSGGTRQSGGQQGGFSSRAFLTMARMLRVSLNEEDVEEIKLFVPGLSHISLYASGKTTVGGGDLDEDLTATCVGVKPEYADITNLSLAYGTFLTESDEENAAKYVVLGAGVAEDIFDSAYEAYNNTVMIDGRLFTVVGVLDSMGSVVSGISPDDAVYLPFSTARKYVLGTAESPSITAVAENPTEVPSLIEQITSVLSSAYSGATFTITDAGARREAAASTANTLSMLLIAVAGIVFLVGGIGIMNVLFVSVKERTREIGILKALGTSRRDILLEFLFEAALISLFGGAVGVGLAYALMPLMEYTGTRVLPTAGGGIIALVFAVLTGTVFGFYPAYGASRLIPIEALNHE